MTENIATRSERRADRKNKRRPIVAVVLATLAIGGIGAAATSAAWTDNVFFSAQAQAATFNLQGSLDGTTWVESDNSGSIQLVVPTSTFANMLPGQTKSVNLYVKNLGSVSAALTGTAAFASGSTFTTAPTLALPGLAATLTPATGSSASNQFTLTVTTPSDWAPINQGKSGTVVVTIAGTATA
ncbi:MAG: hypothetical protein KKH75_09295 [Actinobacteria bacterium]|nr:hypothetical protein [Actinomycetota bacterium]